MKLTCNTLCPPPLIVRSPQTGEVFVRKRGADADPSAAPAFILGAPTAASSSADPVRVTLSDCLACSGCITSAETVLLEAQSAEEFKAQVRAAAVSGGTRAVIVSVSPQSRASLAFAAAGLAAYLSAQLDSAKTLDSTPLITQLIARLYSTNCST